MPRTRARAKHTGVGCRRLRHRLMPGCLLRSPSWSTPAVHSCARTTRARQAEARPSRQRRPGKQLCARTKHDARQRTESEPEPGAAGCVTYSCARTACARQAQQVTTSLRRAAPSGREARRTNWSWSQVPTAASQDVGAPCSPRSSRPFPK